MLGQRQLWLCPQYLGYRTLGPLLAWRLNDRNVPETVSWATPGDRPDTLHSSRPGPEPGSRQGTVFYVGFAASISAAPPTAEGRALTAAARDSAP